MFGTVYVDPPWMERGGGKIKRGADRHYPLMAWHEIVRVINRCDLFDQVGADAHMWLWTTANHRRDAERVIEALGFRQVTEVAWRKARPPTLADVRVIGKMVAEGRDADVLALLQRIQSKSQVGLGQYVRGSHEVCVLATRGNGASVRQGVVPSSVVTAERTAHSRKPAQMRAIIEQASPGPYLELFAREQAPGWVAWGNEIERPVASRKPDGEDLAAYVRAAVQRREGGDAEPMCARCAAMLAMVEEASSANPTE